MGRYHSWVVDRAGFPECLDVTAVSDDGQIMGLKHRISTHSWYTVSSESVLTPQGKCIVDNWLICDFNSIPLYWSAGVMLSKSKRRPECIPVKYMPYSLAMRFFICYFCIAKNIKKMSITHKTPLLQEQTQPLLSMDSNENGMEDKCPWYAVGIFVQEQKEIADFIQSKGLESFYSNGIYRCLKR